MSFTRSEIRDLRMKLEAVLDQFGKDNGLVMSVGTIRFDSNEFHSKLSVTRRPVAPPQLDPSDGRVFPSILPTNPLDRLTFPNVQPAQARTPDEIAFVNNAKSYGLKPEHLGQTVRVNGKPLKIVGCKPRNWKLPIIVEGRDGGRYKIQATAITRALGLNV